MNIVDNRKQATGILERGAIIVAESGRKYLIIRDQLNSNNRLLNIEQMQTSYSFNDHEFTLERINKNFTIEEIIPAAEVQLTIGGIK
ncbi:hypothetical protein CN613_25555 [Bacillus pseudomycoides]|uniref:Uncharacterized protein n=1 Tax=Bacillus pseudomycoides TaxID=64104 RepID=A0A2A8BYK9_9BACI|nr:hypothetical protein [Bacillus pseudomycoides]PEM65313.1 hypothetical protein CN613_25555 [Bacillus pseudomycoides]